MGKSNLLINNIKTSQMEHLNELKTAWHQNGDIFEYDTKKRFNEITDIQLINAINIAKNWYGNILSMEIPYSSIDIIINLKTKDTVTSCTAFCLDYFIKDGKVVGIGMPTETLKTLTLGGIELSNSFNQDERGYFIRLKRFLQNNVDYIHMISDTQFE